MPTPWKRNLEADGRRLKSWLEGRIVDATDVVMSELVAPTGSGFSNETLLFDLSWREGGETRSEKMVVRIQPTGFQVFPDYDLSRQFKAMSRLGETDVPVPQVFWIEEKDSSVLGAPFYVMKQVNGRVPSDQPPYHTGGWMTEISPDERAAIWLGGMESMAKIHRLDYKATGFADLERPDLGANGLDRELGEYEKFHTWAARGREHPITEFAWEWLNANKPTAEPQGLVWGDARIGNIIFDGTRPAAVIDWEMVTLASPEADVGWAIFLDRHHSEGLGVPRLDGFPSYADSVAYYEEISGHKVKNLDYYQIFCGFRFSVIMMRIAQQLVHYEIMPEDGGYAFECNNTVTQLLAKLLELPPPGETTGSFSD